MLAGRAASPSPEAIRQQLSALAGRVTHLATEDIIRNRRSEGQWPTNLVAEQQGLLADLHSLTNERPALTLLLQDADPKVRTLALGALFMREDPQDLPAIATLARDTAATLPNLHRSFNSRPGPLSVTEVESPQSVGDVARAMLSFYLEAAQMAAPRLLVRRGTPPLDTPGLLGKFRQYWSERGNRTNNPSWLLAKMKRATRETLPYQPKYQADIARVLAEVDALPPVERGWTLLYICAGVYRDSSSELVPGDRLAKALEPIGSDNLLKFLQCQPVFEAPDFRLSCVEGEPTRYFYRRMQRLVLAHATKLLRASDADAVDAAADEDSAAWVVAAAELRGLINPEKSAAALKAKIGSQGPAELALALWRLRGAAEQDFLASWFYTALRVAERNSDHPPQVFLAALKKEARPDTSALLTRIVGDARFTRADWACLAEILIHVNATLPAPLVKEHAIYNQQPNSNQPDQRDVLNHWRNLLRTHFGAPAFPPPARVPLAQTLLTTPAWSAPIAGNSEISAQSLAVSPDSRLMAIVSHESQTVVVRAVETQQVLWEITLPSDSTEKHLIFSTQPSHLLLYRSNLDGKSGVHDINLKDRSITQRAIDALPGHPVVFDENLSRLGFPLGVHDLRASRNLWRLAADSPGERAQVSLSAAGRIFAIGGGNWTHFARVFDAASGQLLREFPEFSGTIAGLACTPDGKILATASTAEGVQVWDTVTGELRLDLPWPVPEPFQTRPCLVVSPDGQQLAAATMIIHLKPRAMFEIRVGIFDITTGSLTSEIRLAAPDFGKLFISAMAFAPDGKLFYTAGHQLCAWTLPGK